MTTDYRAYAVALKARKALEDLHERSFDPGRPMSRSEQRAAQHFARTALDGGLDAPSPLLLGISMIQERAATGIPPDRDFNRRLIAITRAAATMREVAQHDTPTAQPAGSTTPNTDARYRRARLLGVI